MLVKLIDAVDGYKTYLIAIAMLAHAVVIVGWQNNNWAAAWHEAQVALLASGFRSAIKK